ncbi:hypothetical protein EPK99_09300 [Neorhizobium lilium]|uniref:O-antigen ligase domain-containing protein n=1 Tax=Neorhizobium lilium TaxID=2503024 RepID=A0A444LIB8_9HYPH|nr:O-antigen ligase family protein [Neorhizobium lilium]RWX78773.1 hypothetical protein EPK99_09300 [Neorhizobium lilium]
MFIPLMILGVLPFIQLGVSYYASVGVVGGLILFWFQRAHLLVLFQRFLLARLAIVALMILFTWGYPGSSSDVLRAAREGIFFFLVTGCVGWRLPGLEGSVTNAARYTKLLLLGLLGLTLLQTFFLSRGVYFGIPRALFSQNSNTIAGELDLYYSDIRPNGPYGEPSYLGGVCLCLMFAFGPILLKKSSVNHNTVLALIVVIVSRSFSGLVFCLLMLFSNLWKLVSSFTTKLFVLAGIVVVCAGLLMTENTVTSRLDRLRSGEDVSSMARVVQPIAMIPDILTRNPTGIPLNAFMELGYVPAVGVYSEDLVHNALLNLILNYGWLGLIAIGVWMCVLPDFNSRLFMLLLAMQNGAILTPDKFVLIALSFMIYNSCRASLPSRAPDQLKVGAQPSAQHEQVVYRPITETKPWN